ncbi:magnesium transporter MgtE N-terminal domain-containing protein [Microbispora rosea]|uniref:magnesium transporter MgtE N-terminal domain-containing protein n=1 Tax=Microbispora rosea TaxID=58117 RepID=UPI003D8E845C
MRDDDQSRFVADTHLHADASGHGRVYQVAQGNMYVGADDMTKIREIVSLPIAEAARRLSQMPTSEAVTVLAAMDPPAASNRLSAMTPDRAADVLTNMDEVAAGVRLAHMVGTSAAEAVQQMPTDRARLLLAVLPYENLVKILATEHFRAILPILPAAAAAHAISGYEPAVMAQVLQTLPEELCFVTWQALPDRTKAAQAFRLMPQDWLRATIAKFQPDQAATLCILLDYAQAAGLICSLPNATDMLSHYWAYIEASGLRSFIGRIIDGLESDLLGSVLRLLPPGNAQRLLVMAYGDTSDDYWTVRMRNERVGKALTQVSDELARWLVSTLPPKAAAEIIKDRDSVSKAQLPTPETEAITAMLSWPDEHLRAALEQMPDAQVQALLAIVPPGRGAQLLANASGRRLRALAWGMPGDRVDKLVAAMPARQARQIMTWTHPWLTWAFLTGPLDETKRSLFEKLPPIRRWAWRTWAMRLMESLHEHRTKDQSYFQ